MTKLAQGTTANPGTGENNAAKPLNFGADGQSTRAEMPVTTNLIGLQRDQMGDVALVALGLMVGALAVLLLRRNT